MNKRAGWLLSGFLACGCLLGQTVYEAETVIVNKDATIAEVSAPDKWCIWSTDVNKHAWSGGGVVRSPIVREDRKSVEEGAPMLHIRLPIPEDGAYTVSMRGAARPLAVSLDGGKSWRKMTQGTIVKGVELKAGHLDLWFDDMYKGTGTERLGPAYLDSFTVSRTIVVNRRVDLLKRNAERWGLEWGSAGEKNQCNVLADGSGVRISVVEPKEWTAMCEGAIMVDPGDVVCFKARVKNVSCEDARLEIVGTEDGRVKIWRMGKGIPSFERSGEWREYSCSLEVPEDIDGLRVRFHGTGAGEMLIGSVSVEPGVKVASQRKPLVKGFAKTRVKERFGRSVIAVKSREGVYVSWRLLKEDASDVGFDVYRKVGGVETKLNKTPIVQTCDFIDAAPVEGAEYIVRGGVAEGRSTVWQTSKGGLAYKSFKLSDPKARAQKVAVADLNGDGEFDYVVKHPHENVDPWNVVWYKSPDTYKLEAFLSDGTRLWTYDLGWSIERGIWYSPYVAYDLNGDGKAEVIAKVSSGDHRSEDGHVYDGPEEFVVLDGMTGKEIARGPWPARNKFGQEGREAYGYSARNLMAVGYLDGKTPCLLNMRGTYREMAVDAWQLNGDKLERIWEYDNSLLPKKWWGQGAHTNYALDVDGDGRDEVVLGSAVIDDNGDPLWSTGKGHPDGVFFGKLIPGKPDLQVGYVMETRQDKGGLCMVDGKTGEIFWELDRKTSHVDGKGTCGDIDPVHPGAELAGGDMNILEPGTNKRGLVAAWFMNAKGEILYEGKDMPYRFGCWNLYWDADLQKEMNRGYIFDHGGNQVSRHRIGGGVMVIADVTGDWREEIINSPVPGEFWIYTTDIPAMDRRPCLMQEHNYRMRILANSMGYNTEALLPYDPEEESPNLNLTCRSQLDVAVVQVVAVASAKSGVKGEVRLGGPDLIVTPNVIPVDLKPGERIVKEVVVEAAGVKSGDMVYGEYDLGNGTVLRGRVPVRLARRMMTGGCTVEAEDIASQVGGEVQIRSDKMGVRGKAFSHWDAVGHTLTWKVNVKEAGEYCVGIRYCNIDGVERRLKVDNVDAGVFTLYGTGGFGGAHADWDHFTAIRNGKPVTFTLSEGVHTITLENVDGKGCNLDYLGFWKVKK